MLAEPRSSSMILANMESRLGGCSVGEGLANGNAEDSW